MRSKPLPASRQPMHRTSKTIISSMINEESEFYLLIRLCLILAYRQISYASTLLSRRLDIFQYSVSINVGHTRQNINTSDYMQTIFINVSNPIYEKNCESLAS